MTNKHTCLIIGAACLLAAQCQAGTVRTEPVRTMQAAKTAQNKPADSRKGGIQEHRRFKRLSLPLR